MSGPKTNIPFLPGNSHVDATKRDFRKPHSLGFVNGYAVQPQPNAGIGMERIINGHVLSEEELLKAVGIDNDLLYGRKRYQPNETASKFVPAHVAYDKVLRFDAYFKQTVHESEEQYHLRRVHILFFLEDDSISVVEPPIENSGIPQGVLIKRSKLPKSSTGYYGIADFNLAKSITFYGKTFRIVSCDAFTQKYMQETEGITLNNPEKMPSDPHQESRTRPARVNAVSTEKRDKLKRFLEKDRKVLRFYCIWDDRSSMFGELREFVLHYHLVDDSIEVREVQKPNNGRDSFPILLRRQCLPKYYRELGDVTDSEKYTWKDLKIGECINVLGRSFLIRDCDAYTRSFYIEMAHEGVAPQAQYAIPVEADVQPKAEVPMPPYNGFGTVEDSMGSCKYLVLKPPRKDFMKLLDNEHKILRFAARMESKHKEDQERRFVISYRLADDMMTIYEPPQRNAGIIGGKFMERTRVLRPGCALTDINGPLYYDIMDLYVGQKLEILSHHFVLIDADEYVFKYMETEGHKFKLSNVTAVKQKVVDLLKSLSIAGKNDLKMELLAADMKNTGQIQRSAFVSIIKKHFGKELTEHEIITFSRSFESVSRRPEYKFMI